MVKTVKATAKLFTIGDYRSNLYFEDFADLTMGSFNATSDLERFSTPFPRVLPDLPVPGDHAHQIHSHAPSVATRCRDRARNERVGSRSRHAGTQRVTTAVSAAGSDRSSQSRRHCHSDCAAPA